MPAPLLQVRGLKTYFFAGSRAARAVDGVSFDLAEGESLALVGESGSGKTATALSILRLIPDPPGRIVGGEILFRGEDLLLLSAARMRSIRGREIAMVFQDPMSALNPVQTVGRQIAEAVRAHSHVSAKAARERAVALLAEVGVQDPEVRSTAYPHQLSGGLRQRVLISMALACRPRILIADEPTTALDATVQMQVIELLRRLMREHGMSLLLITHDMGVVAELADQVAVMYAGRIVERGPVGEVFDRPLHPYTVGLFASLPRLHTPKQALATIPGEVPDLYSLGQGCRFASRCPIEDAACRSQDPPLAVVAPDRHSACLRVESGALPSFTFGAAARPAGKEAP